MLPAQAKTKLLVLVIKTTLFTGGERLFGPFYAAYFLLDKMIVVLILLL